MLVGYQTLGELGLITTKDNTDIAALLLLLQVGLGCGPAGVEVNGREPGVILE